jgi:hypothetical protein
MYCKIFKFITGELVIGITEEEEIDYNSTKTIIFDPIKVEMIRVQAQNSFYDTIIIKPLLPMTDQDYVIIRTQSIVYDGILAASYVQQYRDFIESKSENIKNKQTEQEPDTLVFNTDRPKAEQDNASLLTDEPPDLTDIDEEDPLDDHFPSIPSKPTLH